MPVEGFLGDGLVEGYGMLGQAGSGKLRVSIGQSKLAAKAAKRYIRSFLDHFVHQVSFLILFCTLL